MSLNFKLYFLQQSYTLVTGFSFCMCIRQWCQMLSNLYDQDVANNLRSSPKSCLILLLLFIHLSTYIVIHLFICLSKWTVPKTVWHTAFFFFFSKKLHKFDLLYPNSMKFCSQIATTSINPCSSLKLQFRWHFLTHCKKLPFIFEVK